jgi:hypothetical protein
MADDSKPSWTNWLALTTVFFSTMAAVSSFKAGGKSTSAGKATSDASIATTEASNRWSHYQSKSIKQSVREVALDNDEANLERACAGSPEATELSKQAIAKQKEIMAAKAEKSALLKNDKAADTTAVDAKLAAVRKEVDAIKAQSKVANPGTIIELSEKVAREQLEIARYDKEKSDIMAEAKKVEEKIAGYNAARKDNEKRGAPFSMAILYLQLAIMLSAIAALLKKWPLWAVGCVFGVAGAIYFLNGFYLFF